MGETVHARTELKAPLEEKGPGSAGVEKSICMSIKTAVSTRVVFNINALMHVRLVSAQSSLRLRKSVRMLHLSTYLKDEAVVRSSVERRPGRLRRTLHLLGWFCFRHCRKFRVGKGT